MRYKIILADGHSIYRAGLKVLIEQEADFIVVKEDDSGRRAFLSVLELNPHLVILDVVANGDSADAIKKIKKRCPNVKVLILTSQKEEESVRASLAAGANGYTLKDDSQEQLFISIRTVLEGKTYISPSVSQQIVHGYLGKTSTSSQNSSWDSLTRREHEVLKLVAEGLKSREIAAYLSLSPKTIENHRANLLSKLNFRNTPSLISYAIQNGLL